jgi:hypothetical protein
MSEMSLKDFIKHLPNNHRAKLELNLLKSQRGDALALIDVLTAALKDAEFAKCMNESCRDTSPRFCPVCKRVENHIYSHTEYCSLNNALIFAERFENENK